MPIGSSQWMYATDTTFSIPYSLRCDASNYMQRTPSSAGNRKTWTCSFWLKWTSMTTNNTIIKVPGNNNNTFMRIYFNDQRFWCGRYSQGATGTTGKFLDPASWYHIVFRHDSTQATGNDRMRIYVNGVREDGGISEDISQNDDNAVNNNTNQILFGPNGSERLDGLVADFYMIDGQSLAPTEFGETDEDYDYWKPKKYTGTYGSQGYHLEFKQTGSGQSASTAGADTSGNGNHFDAVNISAHDQMLDTPTNNFPVLNRNCCHQDIPITQGTILTGDASGGTYGCAATMSIPSTGKWYWEVYAETLDSSRPNHYYGVDETEVLTHRTVNKLASGHLATTYVYQSNGNGTRNNDSESAYGAAWSDNDIIGVALDMDNGTLKYYRNNTAESSGANAFTGLGSKNLVPTFGLYRDGANAASNTCIVNFGQDSSFTGQVTAQSNSDGNGIGDFYYTPPTGYLALCTSNLPAVAVVPSGHFNTILYTGDGTSEPTGQPQTGVGFQPDFVWIKNRGTTPDHYLHDSVRGVNKRIKSNSTDAEYADNNALLAFGSDGFTVADDTAVGANTNTYVAWNWKAGSSVSGNTSGSGDDTAYTGSVNTDAGFSIIRYGGNDTAGHQIPHHLGVVPDAIFIKNLTVQSWQCFFPNVSSMGATKGLQLDNTGAANTVSWINDAMPTTSVVYLSAGAATNASNDTTPPQPYIMYCWKSIEGYSKVGQYDGNSNADGTFVYTGFRPAYVMVKRVNTTDSWLIQDNKRETYNPMDDTLAANSNGAEDADTGGMPIDFLSNGIKMRGTGGDFNVSQYIYIAFAETPFKYATAR